MKRLLKLVKKYSENEFQEAVKAVNVGREYKGLILEISMQNLHVLLERKFL